MYFICLTIDYQMIIVAAHEKFRYSILAPIVVRNNFIFFRYSEWHYSVSVTFYGPFKIPLF